MPAPLHPPRLTLVTDRALSPTARLAEHAVALAAAGLDAVQMREKDLPHDELLALAATLVPAFRAIGVRVFINSSVEVALAVGADGVQLGEGGVSVAEARRQATAADKPLLIGRSVHDLAGALAAERAGADLLVLGTIYPSRSHPGGAAAGPALVHAVAERVCLPVLAIGGVTEANAADVIAAGAKGVAVISAILGAADMAEATRRLRAVVDKTVVERDGRSALQASGTTTQARIPGTATAKRDGRSIFEGQQAPSLVGKSQIPASREALGLGSSAAHARRSRP